MPCATTGMPEARWAGGVNFNRVAHRSAACTVLYRHSRISAGFSGTIDNSYTLNSHDRWKMKVITGDGSVPWP
jgi:hypothetical protein